MALAVRTDNPWPEFSGRLAASARMPAATLPGPRMEAWKYTNLRPLTGFGEVVSGAEVPLDMARLGPLLTPCPTPRIVLVNGVWRPELNVLDGAEGVEICSAVPEPVNDSPLAAVSAGAATTGVEISVADGTALDKPLWVVHVLLTDTAKTDALTFGAGWLHLRLGKGGRLTLVEAYMGTPTSGPAGWLCDSRKVTLEAEAELRHVVIQDLPQTDFLTVTDQVNVADTGDYRRDLVQVGARLSRYEADVTTGWAAFCRLNTVQLTADAGTEAQLHDVTSRIFHMAAASRSEVTQRNVLAGQGHGVFQGKFYVAQPAQKTDAYMRCENLLLSDNAKIDQKPELEIYADDVKCSHGASTGGLDENQIFYLKARGLDEAASRKLLVEGFAMAALDGLPESVQKHARGHVLNWLERAG